MNTRSPLKSLSRKELPGEQQGKSPCELRPLSSAHPHEVKSNRACIGSKTKSTSFQSTERLVVTCLLMFPCLL
jgi:hypothetical protein